MPKKKAAPRRTSAPPVREAGVSANYYPSLDMRGVVQMSKMSPAKEQAMIDLVSNRGGVDVPNAKYPTTQEQFGTAIPRMQMRATHTPIYLTHDIVPKDWVSGIRSGGETLSLPKDMSNPIVIVSDRGSYGGLDPSTLAHEMIHVSQRINPEQHEQARKEVSGSALNTSAPYYAVLKRAYGDKPLEAEAYIGSGDVSFNENIAKAYKGEGNFVKGKPALTAWDNLMLNIKNIIPEEPYGEEEFRKTRDVMTEGYSPWLKQLLGHLVGPTK